MEKIIRPFGIRRNVDYLSTKLYLSIQRLKEYKTDFWSMMFFDIFLFISMMITYFVIGGLIFSSLTWRVGDFFLFFCMILLAWKILWIWGLRNFNQRLLKGDINVYLVRPINVYFSAATEGLNFNNFITGIGLFLIGVIYILSQKLYSNYLLSFFIFILGCTYLMLFVNFSESLAFIFKQNSFLQNILNTTEGILERFTPRPFENSPFKFIIYAFPTSIIFLSIEVLNNRLDLFYYYLPLLIYGLIFLFIGTCLLWYYGLKNYEAFG